MPYISDSEWNDIKNRLKKLEDRLSFLHESPSKRLDLNDHIDAQKINSKIKEHEKAIKELQDRI